MGLQDATLEDFQDSENPLTGLPEDASGQKFGFIPKWNAHLALFTPLPVEITSAPWLSGITTPRLDWTYRSEVQWFSPYLNEGGTPNAALTPPFNLLNFRVTHLFDDGAATVALFAENLLDETSFGVNPLGQRLMGSILRYWPEGRAFGGELTYRS